MDWTTTQSKTFAGRKPQSIGVASTVALPDVRPIVSSGALAKYHTSNQPTSPGEARAMHARQVSGCAVGLWRNGEVGKWT
ncbi:hypothetical protein ZHAS_00005077 [Anopheles sinensis]|uniref:Uncharacterized protein n=1 Tax=Anopheles sinensis TaxID=74873 RepID=A0A084VIG8_ANOSI|nr:hypothetical protein ZHAS_00005077 [Anopheles sinensis]